MLAECKEEMNDAKGVKKALLDIIWLSEAESRLLGTKINCLKPVLEKNVSSIATKKKGGCILHNSHSIRRSLFANSFRPSQVLR